MKPTNILPLIIVAHLLTGWGKRTYNQKVSNHCMDTIKLSPSKTNSTKIKAIDHRIIYTNSYLHVTSGTPLALDRRTNEFRVYDKRGLLLF